MMYSTGFFVAAGVSPGGAARGFDHAFLVADLLMISIEKGWSRNARIWTV
jgi:hypothetical protein